MEKNTVRFLRRKLALTQEELAAKAGITVATLSRLENRLHEPTPPTMKAIASALGVKPASINW